MAKKAKAKIKVYVGKLMSNLQASNIEAGTTLANFLTAKGIEYSTSVRVNGDRARKDYRLHAEDLITIVDAVNGGI